MGGIDFPTWFALGSYGGLVCSVASATAIALYAFGRRRGSSRQLVAALLVCLIASALMFGPIWWAQNRLDVYGPTLDGSEVALALAVSAALGWLLPLATFSSYVVFAGPSSLGLSSRYPAYRPAGAARVARASAPRFAAVNDPARRRPPLADEQPWGQLVPLDEAGAVAGRPLPLLYALTLLGREIDNDVVTDDERTSRHHAEIHWDHGHPQLLDRASMNGTLLNQQMIHGYTPLQSGDILEVGAQRYRYETLVATPLRLEDQETRKVRGIPQEPQKPEAPTLELVALASVAAPAAETDQDHRAVGRPLRWTLQAPLITIGRDAECAIVLSDASVSRLHAQIVRQPGGFFVSDLRSSNGAWLNERRLTEPTQIHPGDVLRIGEVTLICEAAPHPGLVVVGSAPTATAAAMAIEANDHPTADHAMPASNASNGSNGSNWNNGNGAATMWRPPALQMMAPANTSRANHPHLAPPHLLPDSTPDSE